MIFKVLKTSIALVAFVIGVGLTSYWALQKQSNIGLNQVTIDNPRPADNPVPAPDQRRDQYPQTLEMVFVIDTTGSMGGLIEGAKQRVWRIVNEVMQEEYRPDVRVGLVAYRDRGDDYISRVTPLTDDLDVVYSTLLNFRAAGGGDTPEDVKRGLMDGIERAGWSRSDRNVTKVLFLVGDAPPHNDYPDEPGLSAILSNAVQHRIIINSIQCGNAPDTARVWRNIAQMAYGEYFPIPQDGGVEQVSTPYDRDMAELSRKLGDSYMAYGSNREEVQARTRTQAANESKVAGGAPMAAQADRAVNKAINKQAYNGDLIQDIENGNKKLEDVKEKDLPDDIQSLRPEQRKAEIEKRMAERKKIRGQILSLTAQREKYLKEHAATGKNGKTNSFDAAVADALKKQMKAK